MFKNREWYDMSPIDESTGDKPIDIFKNKWFSLAMSMVASGLLWRESQIDIMPDALRTAIISAIWICYTRLILTTKDD